MAEVNLTVYQINRTSGVDYTTNKTTCATGSNYHVLNDGNTRLLMAAATTSAVTVVTPNTDPDANAVGDRVITLADTKIKEFGPWPVNIYGADLVFSVSANTDVIAIRG